MLILLGRVDTKCTKQDEQALRDLEGGPDGGRRCLQYCFVSGQPVVPCVYYSCFEQVTIGVLSEKCSQCIDEYVSCGLKKCDACTREPEPLNSNGDMYHMMECVECALQNCRKKRRECGEEFLTPMSWPFIPAH